MKAFITFVVVCVVAFILNYVSNKLLLKKCNQVTAAIFSFVAVGFLLFLLFPYFVEGVNHAWFLLPPLFLLLVKDFYFMTE